jgi:hypothetical protein
MICPCQVPLRLVPEIKDKSPLTECCPDGLEKATTTYTTPERSSLACAVAVIAAEVVVVFTELGVKVKLFSVGGVISEARAGRTKRQMQANTLAAFLTKLLPMIDICTSSACSEIGTQCCRINAGMRTGITERVPARAKNYMGHSAPRQCAGICGEIVRPTRVCAARSVVNEMGSQNPHPFGFAQGRLSRAKREKGGAASRFH